jgi:hypothetical protein
MYEQLVALEYPNGRMHMCTIKSPRELTTGSEFGMFGRVWRVSRVRRPPSRPGFETPYLVCVEVQRSHLPR